jgi:hypothetical protein
MAEEACSQGRQQSVAQDMTRPVGKVAFSDPGCDHHIEAVSKEVFDQGRRTGRVIGVVAVNQDVEISFNVGEHPAHNIAFALTGFAADFRAMTRGNGNSLVS